MNSCNVTMKWCTVSDEEQQKCLWLRKASINQGFVPVIECVKNPNKLLCLEEIEHETADIVNIDDYIYIAAKCVFFM